MTAFDSFLVALQFLTRVPVNFRRAPSKQAVGHSLAFYPLIGVLLGAAVAALYSILGNASDSLRAALVLGAWILLTGALHLDGLADSADAWVGGIGSRERTLAIMKDPYCGPAAVVTLVIVLLTKFSALQALQQNAWISLLLIPMLARAAVPLLFITTPYVRTGGLGAVLATNAPHAVCVVAIAGAAILTVFLDRTAGAWLLLTMLAVWGLLRNMMKRRIGGTTGDTAGALIELGETTMLVTAAFA